MTRCPANEEVPTSRTDWYSSVNWRSIRLIRGTPSRQTISRPMRRRTTTSPSPTEALRPALARDRGGGSELEIDERIDFITRKAGQAEKHQGGDGDPTPLGNPLEKILFA